MNTIRSAFAKALLARQPKSSRPRPYAAVAETQPERVAAEMINYALGDARSRGSSVEAMRILEQGATNLQGGGEGSAEAVGLLMLAMSTLLYQSGRRRDAMEKLKAIQQEVLRILEKQENRSEGSDNVAAWEAQMGLRMEAGQDFSSSMSPDDSVDLLIKGLESEGSELEHLKLRANAVKGLADLLNGETESAKLFFESCKDCSAEVGKDHLENAFLSYGEYLHCTGDFSMATYIYEQVLQALDRDVSGKYLAAANMVLPEVSLGATCSFGQLLSHSGKVGKAEELLTKALTKAEDLFGANHPKVGIVLTCLARMYKEKSKSEGSSSILVQEGLYRKALELLKAPALNSEGAGMLTDWRDITSLARGEYAELLLIQSNRKEEGERMKKWAEAAWMNRRLTLAQVLEFSEPSKSAAVIDTRLGRVL